MIHLLPYMEYKIECERSVEEVCAILKKVTDTRKGAFRNYINTEFNGNVSSSGFRESSKDIIDRLEGLLF